jgi:FkbM family methyltransferase
MSGECGLKVNKMLSRARAKIVSKLHVALSRCAPSRCAPVYPPDLSWEYFFHQIRSHDIRIRSVFDVGVAAGTPELYSAFPDADLFLFDPTRQAAQHMQKIAAERSAAVFNVALGEANGTIRLFVPDAHASATVFEEVDPVSSATETVAVARFDDLVPEVKGPALCKIDVQGAELMVLQGMTNAIPTIDFFILEVSTIPTLVDAPDFAEVNAFMQARGFVVYDILSLLRRPLDGALAQMDVGYVRRNSVLRRDKRWG